jgi:hypothetical protein
MLLKEARSRRRTCTGRRRPTRPSCPSEATLPRGREGQCTAVTHTSFPRRAREPALQRFRADGRHEGFRPFSARKAPRAKGHPAEKSVPGSICMQQIGWRPRQGHEPAPPASGAGLGCLAPCRLSIPMVPIRAFNPHDPSASSLFFDSIAETDCQKIHAMVAGVRIGLLCDRRG